MYFTTWKLIFKVSACFFRLFLLFAAQIFALVLIIAVMFTFSFSSAFAALQYEGTTTIDKPVAEKTDFKLADKGTFGISTVEQQVKVVELENAKDAVDGAYPADLQAKVDAAYDTAIAAVKAAKTAKEMAAAKEALDKELTTLDAANNTYAKLKTAYAAKLANVKFVVDKGYYMVPDCGLIEVGQNGEVTAADDIVFNWLMDQGYYGYTDADAWEKVVTDKAVKNAVVAWLEAYYIGKTTLDDVYQGKAMASVLEKYGRTVYAEYADAVGTFEEYASASKKTTTIDEYVAVMDKLAAFNTKYGFDGKVAVDPAATYTINGDNKLLVAIDKWYISNLEDAVEAIEKINTAAGYTAAKADIIAAAKKVVEVKDKYGKAKYKGLAAAMLGNAETKIVNALKTAMKADTTELDKVCKDTAYTENKPVSNGTATFDSSEDNLAAIAAARKAFDAYVADYTFAYEADGRDVSGIAKLVDLAAYEVKLLAAEYNKTAVPAAADDEFAEKSAFVQAYLNNATVKVTTKALGNKKVRVQARFDNATYVNIVTLLEEGDTISYQFYYKKAANSSYKAGKVKDVNYTTFKLAKGVKYNFQCKVVIKDKDGKVIATKDYKASTVGTRTVK